MSITLPDFTSERLISEAVSAFDLRHPEAPVDAVTADWSQLYAIVPELCQTMIANIFAPAKEDAD